MSYHHPKYIQEEDGTLSINPNWSEEEGAVIESEPKKKKKKKEDED